MISRRAIGRRGLGRAIGRRVIGRLALALALWGCGEPETPQLTVLAASSLTEAFGDLERAFEAAHPGVDVVVSFGGSQSLATQVRHGIRADVLASADEAHVATLADEGLVESPRPFARSGLALVVPHDAGELDLAELPEVERIVLGGDDVPVGRYARALLDAAGRLYGADWREAVRARVVSREPNARLVLAKVALGEADAAIVYATDTTSGVRTVALPEGLAPTVGYHHAVLASARWPELARRWLAFVESPDGRAALAARGFRATSSH